jgi:hypothetical protein
MSNLRFTSDLRTLANSPNKCLIFTTDFESREGKKLFEINQIVKRLPKKVKRKRIIKFSV